MRKLLILLTLLALLTLPALAQTPEPTAVATPDATAQASATPEAEATDAAPVIEVTIEAPDDSVSSEAYFALLDRMTVIFIALISVAGTVGGVVGGVSMWRIAGIGLVIAEVVALITPDKRDDAKVAEWRAAYEEKKMAEAAKAGTQLAISEAIGAEREKLTAKAINFAPKNSVDD
jgi:hypothetical protein